MRDGIGITRDSVVEAQLTMEKMKAQTMNFIKKIHAGEAEDEIGDEDDFGGAYVRTRKEIRRLKLGTIVTKDASKTYKCVNRKVVVKEDGSTYPFGYYRV